MPEEQVIKLAALIKHWGEQTKGWFTSGQLDSELDIGTPEGKGNRRGIVKRLCDAGFWERRPGWDGWYRLVDREAKEIDWESADPSAVLPLRFPFGLEKYVKIYPGSIIVIAGTPNAGKTAFCFNLLLMNMRKYAIELYLRQTSKEEMKERMDALAELCGYEIPNPAPWGTYERYDNYADVVSPDRITIIDFLDMSKDLFLVGDEFEKLDRKLDKGIAVVAIQKPEGRELGSGGHMSEKLPNLYLSMERSSVSAPGKLTIRKAKSWVDSNVNPNNMQWSFKLVKGAKFVDIKPIYGGER